MKIEMGKVPVRISLDSPAVGDVYRAKGGSRGITRFFVVAAINGNMAHALGLDKDGNIVSTTSYATYVFAGRDLVGRIAGLDELTLDIDWEPL